MPDYLIPDPENNDIEETDFYVSPQPEEKVEPEHTPEQEEHLLDDSVGSRVSSLTKNAVNMVVDVPYAFIKNGINKLFD